MLRYAIMVEYMVGFLNRIYFAKEYNNIYFKNST